VSDHHVNINIFMQNYKPSSCTQYLSLFESISWCSHEEEGNMACYDLTRAWNPDAHKRYLPLEIDVLRPGYGEIQIFWCIIWYNSETAKILFYCNNCIIILRRPVHGIINLSAKNISSWECQNIGLLHDYPEKALKHLFM
jgi:hypothetical protein